MKRGRKKKQSPLDAMCEQLIQDNRRKADKKSAESALEALNQSLSKIREWSGDLSTAPGWIVAYHHWLDRFEFPLEEVFRFLAKAGLWQPQKIDVILEQRRLREEKQAGNRKRWKANKAVQRGRTTRR